MTEKIRLFSGPNNTTTIGFPENLLPFSAKEYAQFITDFLEPLLSSRGYTVQQYNHPMEPEIGNHIDTLNRLGVGVLRCVGVEPPLSSGHANELAEWCAQYTYVDHNEVGSLVDNREREPRNKSKGLEATIGYWYRTPGTWTGYDQVEPRLHKAFDNY